MAKNTVKVPYQLVGEHYVSDVNGLSIAWVFCGLCNAHISRCNCPSGPCEPAYLTKMRDNGHLATPVASEALNVSAGPRPSRGLSIGDLVDDDVIAKVKAARQ